jgi:tRNA U54 and U55 pseudouridine synthase Pus10
MSKIESICLNLYTLVNIQKEVKYSTNIREEECHGFHTFIDQEELSNEINRVVIKVLGNDIDITNRLTKDEIALLEKLETDEIEINEDSVY